MGYAALHIRKPKGNDSGTTAHIERKVKLENANAERSHLNRELIEFPDGVANRTEAIQHRIETAGITRKISHVQVRALQVMMTGTPEDMPRIQKEGRLDDWCKDNIEWMQSTFGKENVVSAVLHMDEKTPHIHGTIVPIVTGETRKAREKKKKDDPGKRKYRKKPTDTVRLCADDVMTRKNLELFQDTYAGKMAKYGLQRGIRGSDARHISKQEFNRDLAIKKNKLEKEVENVEAMLQDKQREISATEQKILWLDKSIRKEELKSKTVDTAIKVVEKVGSLVYDSKDKEYQKKIRQLSYSIDENERTIVSLRTEMENTHEDYRKQLGKKDDEIKAKDNEIAVRAFVFPFHDVFARMFEFLYKIGIKGEKLRKLFKFEPVRLSGKIYSNEFRRDYSAENATARLDFRPTEKRLDFLIDDKNHVQWFREKHRQNMPEWEKNLELKKQQPKGMKLG